MPHLSWNEVRDRAIRFSRDPLHTRAKSERAEKQTFWNAFFEVFGLREAGNDTGHWPLAARNCFAINTLVSPSSTHLPCTISNP